MNARCPICGAPYSLVERLSQPTMCKACYTKYGSSSPLGSFDEELTVLEEKGASLFRQYGRGAIVRAITIENLAVGVILTLLGPAFAALAIALFPALGLLVGSGIGAGLVLIGLVKLISGFF